MDKVFFHIYWSFIFETLNFNTTISLMLKLQEMWCIDHSNKPSSEIEDDFNKAPLVP